MSEYTAALDRLRSAQKSSSGAAAYSRFVNRPLGRRLAALAYVLRLSPSQVTLLSALCTFTAIALIAAVSPTWWSCVVIALAIGLALQGLALAKVAKVGTAVNLVVSWSSAWWLVAHDHADRFDALPFAVAIALWAHMLGDALTHERLPMPVMWLLGSRRRIGLPLFITGTRTELAVVTPLLQVLLVALWFRHVGVHDAGSAQAELAHLVRVARDGLSDVPPA